MVSPQRPPYPHIPSVIRPVWLKPYLNAHRAFRMHRALAQGVDSPAGKCYTRVTHRHLHAWYDHRARRTGIPIDSASDCYTHTAGQTFLSVCNKESGSCVTAPAVRLWPRRPVVRAVSPRVLDRLLETSPVLSCPLIWIPLAQRCLEHRCGHVRMCVSSLAVRAFAANASSARIWRCSCSVMVGTALIWRVRPTVVAWLRPMKGGLLTIE